MLKRPWHCPSCLQSLACKTDSSWDKIEGSNVETVFCKEDSLDHKSDTELHNLLSQQGATSSGIFSSSAANVQNPRAHHVTWSTEQSEDVL